MSMRWIITTAICGLLCVGCASDKQGQPAPKADKKTVSQKSGKVRSKNAASTNEAPDYIKSSLTITNGARIITLTQMVSGKVATVNSALRFVVLNFTLNRPPELQQKLGVYRGTLKVGEVKVTGPEMNGNIVADLTAGEAQAGDEVRPE
jgi:hypothetical protein